MMGGEVKEFRLIALLAALLSTAAFAAVINAPSAPMVWRVHFVPTASRNN
jgi:hypothetical protein